MGHEISGRYLVESVVGRGGMGTVYRARQRDLGRSVAIKVILRELANSDTVLERFRREASTMAKIHHPNVVTVFDFSTLDDGRAYLVMEFLTGHTLEDWLKEHGKVPVDLAVEILKPVCKAISALHRAGIVHRDIKPSNIILPDPSNEDDVIKVVDFGIARLRDVDGAKLTGNTILGTPEFLAPEIIDGEEASERSDIYALGIIAYQLVTGKLPFEGASSGAILMQHLTKPPVPPSEVATDLDVSIDAPIMKALEKSPDQRTQSVEAFIGEIVAATEADSGRAESADEPTVETPPEQGGPSILVIDDDEDLLWLSQVALEDAGYTVTTASDGVEALMCLGGKSFDLILSDVDMPNLDGFQLLEMTSKKGLTTPVVFITGRVDTDNELKGLELGAEDYLRKPLLPDVLLARVKKILMKYGR